MSDQPTHVYRAEFWYHSASIKKVRIIKLTEKSCLYEYTDSAGMVIQTREKLRNRYSAIYRTWEEAHIALMDKAEEKLDGACQTLQQAQGIHGYIKYMKKPPRTKPHEKADYPRAQNENPGYERVWYDLQRDRSCY